MRALKAKRRSNARKGEDLAKLLRQFAPPVYPAKTSMHPMLRRMLGEILVIELALCPKETPSVEL